jgi:hypothetical protein
MNAIAFKSGSRFATIPKIRKWALRLASAPEACARTVIKIYARGRFAFRRIGAIHAEARIHRARIEAEAFRDPVRPLGSAGRG